MDDRQWKIIQQMLAADAQGVEAKPVVSQRTLFGIPSSVDIALRKIVEEDEMKHRDIETLRSWINGCAPKRLVFFGGAGVSTESGIPDFRSADGLYAQKYGLFDGNVLHELHFFCTALRVPLSDCAAPGIKEERKLFRLNKGILQRFLKQEYCLPVRRKEDPVRIQTALFFGKFSFSSLRVRPLAPVRICQIIPFDTGEITRPAA